MQIRRKKPAFETFAYSNYWKTLNRDMQSLLQQ